MRVVILDGYTDEPAGLGVPPYIDVYPRYVAGAVWTIKHSAEVIYFTVDDVRKNFEAFIKTASRADLVVFIAGVVVPGKYLGGVPITLEELVRWPVLSDKPIKVLGGPAARFGFGIEGGMLAKPPEFFEAYFDVVARGDLEVIVADLLRENLRVERVDPYRRRRDYSEIAEYAVRGARVVTQHPNFRKNLIAEIETFRGCPRWVTGGCSFCIEPKYGAVVFRDVDDILREVEALYNAGVRCFRLGRQPDILAYMAKGTNEVEFPEPNPEALRKLFAGIRRVAPDLETLHIDNVNPGTIAHHPQKAREALKVIVEYHTPGDVAAMGVESADSDVVKANNLKAYPEESLEAIRIVNEVGSRRGYNGLPELLPGINFVIGLMGETAKTFERNLEFLRRILEEGLLVRRVNIRQVLPLPGTRMWSVGVRFVRKHKRLFRKFKDTVRREFDHVMLKRIVPQGTVMRGLYVEAYEGKHSLARQPASYPLLVYLPLRLPMWTKLDVVIIDHGYRSVTGLPYPLNVNTAPRHALRLVPGISEAKVAALLAARPLRRREDLVKIVGAETARYLSLDGVPRVEEDRVH